MASRKNKPIDKKYCEMVIEAAKQMAGRALTVATWGNISIRDPETGHIYVTPSGMDYDKSTPEDVVAFNSDGIRIYGLRKPTIEKDLHIELYQARDDIDAVIHTHSTFSIAIGVAGLALPAVTEEFAQTIGKEAPLCRYAIPGSPDLAKYVVEAFGDTNHAALLPSHGAVCGGRDIKMALKQCDVLERNAEIYILARSLGGKVRIIPDDDVDHMFRFHNNQYGQ